MVEPSFIFLEPCLRKKPLLRKPKGKKNFLKAKRENGCSMVKKATSKDASWGREDPAPYI